MPIKPNAAVEQPPVSAIITFRNLPQNNAVQKYNEGELLVPGHESESNKPFLV